MRRDTFKENDHVTKGEESGIVQKRVSNRTGRVYLTVKILTGPRAGLGEFPELGWRLDDGRTVDDGRPSHEPEDYIGSQAHRTRHHA